MVPTTGNRLKFRIYMPGRSGLVVVQSVNRTPTGLYFNRLFGGRASHQTYHEDGKRWSQGILDRNSCKILDTPLSSFTGTRTLVSMVCVRNHREPHPDERKVNLRPEDIVLNDSAIVGYELILSDGKVDLPIMPNRANRHVYVKDSVFPLIIIEAYDPIVPIMSERYPRLEPRTEGVDLFFDHPGRI